MRDEIKIVEGYLNYNHNSFIDNLIVQIATQQNECILQEISKSCIKIGVYVDEERLRNWIKMCNALENIPIEISTDIALESKFKRLQDRVKKLEYENNELKARLDKEVE